MRDWRSVSIVSTHHPPASRSAAPQILMDGRIITTHCKKPVKEVEDYAVVVNAVDTSTECVRIRAKAMGGASETCPSRNRDLFSGRDL